MTALPFADAEYEWNGHMITISVTEDHGTFFGEWYCQTCGVRGASSKACKSHDDAIKAASMNTMMHTARPASEQE